MATPPASPGPLRLLAVCLPAVVLPPPRVHVFVVREIHRASSTGLCDRFRATVRYRVRPAFAESPAASKARRFVRASGGGMDRVHSWVTANNGGKYAPVSDAGWPSVSFAFSTSCRRSARNSNNGEKGSGVPVASKRFSPFRQ